MRASAERVRLQDAAAATGNGGALNVAGAARLGVQLSGTFVATVFFEITIDGANWIPIAMTPAGGGAGVTNTAAPNILSAAVSGFALFRARISAFTSGTVTVDALVTEAAA